MGITLTDPVTGLTFSGEITTDINYSSTTWTYNTATGWKMGIRKVIGVDNTNGDYKLIYEGDE